MGFDLHGLKAKSKRGEYFRNNCWWWRPLWEFVCNVCEDILNPDQRERGNCNDGIIVSDQQCQEIAERLGGIIKAGDHRKYAMEWTEFHKAIPDIKCYMCKGTGKRHDAFVQGKCNVCGGKGERRPDECSYPFSAENVEEFLAFVRTSGGFEIW